MVTLFCWAIGATDMTAGVRRVTNSAVEPRLTTAPGFWRPAKTSGSSRTATAMRGDFNVTRLRRSPHLLNDVTGGTSTVITGTTDRVTSRRLTQARHEMLTNKTAGRQRRDDCDRQRRRNDGARNSRSRRRFPPNRVHRRASTGH